MAMDPALLDSSTLAGTNSSQDSLATTSLGEGIDEEEAILAELVETAILAGFESTSNCSSGQVRKGSLDQCAINCEHKSSGCSSSRSIRVDDQRNAAFGLDSGRKMLRNQTSCVFPRRGCAVRPWKGPLPKKKNLPKIKLDAFMPENFKSSSVRVESLACAARVSAWRLHIEFCSGGNGPARFLACVVAPSGVGRRGKAQVALAPRQAGSSL